jgi:hypothetical protein
MESCACSSTPVQKFKESCDLCSASKVRCDKQRPTCARCANLHQPCSYSPARRAGRPWRVRLDKRQQHSSAMPATSKSLPAGSAKTPDLSSEISFEDSLLPSTQARRLHDDKQSQATPPTSPLGLGDCATLAVSILEQLDTGGGNGNPGTMYSNLLIADACQRLLTILVCPCSEQPDVALLVACGCMSLMDVVRHLNTANTAEGNISDWPVSPPLHSMMGNDQSRVDQLAKIAKVVLNFTEKYSLGVMDGSGWANTTWVVAPIVALLRSRLQSATHEATGRLLI